MKNEKIDERKLLAIRMALGDIYLNLIRIRPTSALKVCLKSHVLVGLGPPETTRGQRMFKLAVHMHSACKLIHVNPHILSLGVESLLGSELISFPSLDLPAEINNYKYAHLLLRLCLRIQLVYP